MTIAMQDQTQLLADPLVVDRKGHHGPDWLQARRVEAAERFNELGVPTIRDEEWRFTSLKPLTQLQLSDARAETRVAAAMLEPWWFPGLAAGRLVFVNGAYRPEVSAPRALPAGVIVNPLREAWADHATLIEPHLDAHRFADDAFAALNTAMMEDGLFVYVPRGVRVEEPLHVLCLTAGDGTPVHTQPRLLVVAEDGSHVQVIEDHVSERETPHFTNAVSEIVVGANADVHHYLITRECRTAINVSTLRVHQARDSRFASHSALLGGALVRNNVNPILDGTGCHSLLNGLYVGQGTQHLDNHMRVEHRQPHGDSRQYYRGILGDASHGVFTGRIIVSRDAQKTDAVQSNANLLLSRSARANTKPQLEIYADDVKCTHGATIGELDEQAIFYLRSRGMSETQARAMLVFAFAGEGLERMELPPVRQVLEAMILDRIGTGEGFLAGA